MSNIIELIANEAGPLICCQFLKWNNPSSIFGTVKVIIFRDIRMRTWKLFSQQYRDWSDCTDMQASLALYWWQRLITFSSDRIRAKWMHCHTHTTELSHFKQETLFHYCPLFKYKGYFRKFKKSLLFLMSNFSTKFFFNLLKMDCPWQADGC